MDLIADNLPAAFGLLLGEAISRLVDDHDESLDKRAAMLRVDTPKFSQGEGRFGFEFRMRPNRKPPYLVNLDVSPEIEEDDDALESPLDLSLRTVFHAIAHSSRGPRISFPVMADAAARSRSPGGCMNRFSRRNSEEVFAVLQ